MDPKFLKILLLLLFSLSSPIIAQNNLVSKIDSLSQILERVDVNNIDKVNSYLELSTIFLKKNLDSALINAEKGNILAKKSNYNKGVALSLIRLGQVKEIENEIDGAIKLLNEAIIVYGSLNEDQDYLEACNLLGYFHESQSDYDNSLELYMQGLKSAKTQNNLLYQAFFLNNISNIYDLVNNDEESLNFVLEASSIFEDLGKKKYYGYTLVNIGILYTEQEQYDLAIKYLKKAEEIHTLLGDYYGLATIDINLAELAEAKKEYKNAVDYFLSAYRYAELLEDTDPEKNIMKANIHKDLGNIYFSLKDYNTALIEFKSSLVIGEKVNSLSLLKSSYKGIYHSYTQLKNIDSTNKYLNLFLPINDSLIAETYNEKIDALNYNHQLSIEKERHKQELQTSNLSRKRQRLYFGVIGLLLISGLIILSFLGYAQKNKAAKAKIRSNNLALEKENLSLKLDKKEKELTTSVLNLVERNEFISKLMDDLKQISFNDEQSNQIKDIIKSTAINDSKQLWKEFELRYTQNNKPLFFKLANITPNLTANDKRLIALIMLNFSTKEISSITYQSSHSIKIARYRLRKKLNLEKNENLLQFFNNL